MKPLSAFFQTLFAPLRRQDPGIYNRTSRWKWYLSVAGLVIIGISAIYTNYLVKALQAQERVQMDYYQKSQSILGSVIDFNALPESIKDLITRMSTGNETIPIILTDDQNNLVDARNVSGIDTAALMGTGIMNPRDSAYLAQKIKNLEAQNRLPILVKDDDGHVINKIYYEDSRILTLLKYYPFFQFVLIALFISFGYLAFSAARRSEQNQVWVGMAKETAHQLGTPIAAILGWLELLKTLHETDESTQDIVNELNNDVSRLTLVADRFSKIGSEPELTPVNMYDVLSRCHDYMSKRAPRKVIFDFPTADDRDETALAQLNNHLFDWVIENLLRNALDAMRDGSGRISARIHTESQWVSVDITDTGEGIAANKFRTVFKPGFTTKKRGWGLGLSLAKRIIENYHGGKIFVKNSEIGKGTTFCIKLPRV